MAQVVTAAQLRIDAHELMEQALHALDCVGESLAANHLDLAIETLGLRSEQARAMMLATLTDQPPTVIRLARPASQID